MTELEERLIKRITFLESVYAAPKASPFGVLRDTRRTLKAARYDIDSLTTPHVHGPSCAVATPPECHE